MSCQILTREWERWIKRFPVQGGVKKRHPGKRRACKATKHVFCWERSFRFQGSIFSFKGPGVRYLEIISPHHWPMSPDLILLLIGGVNWWGWLVEYKHLYSTTPPKPPPNFPKIHHFLNSSGHLKVSKKAPHQISAAPPKVGRMESVAGAEFVSVVRNMDGIRQLSRSTKSKSSEMEIRQWTHMNPWGIHV